MTSPRIERCSTVDARWLGMRRALWPDAEADALDEVRALLARPDRDAAFIAIDDCGAPLGFAEAALRSDYVNGTDSSPAAFLEGLYVMPLARRSGVAASLVREVERWAKALGCREIASDARLDNLASHSMHAALGFAETERVVFFRKMLAGFLLALAAIASPPPALAADDSMPFPNCVASLRKELPQHARVTAATFDAYTRDAQDLRPTILAASASQPEFKLSIWDYVARLVDDQRIADGRDVLRREAPALEAIAKRRGVDGATAVAVFGVETDYGRVRGKYPVVDATLSRACLALDSGERKRHFFDALWLLQQGIVKADTFVGSWAGAFGMTQFMPGTFAQYMDDGDGSGTADIIGSAPDALATTARYLEGLGWREGLPWGVEVTVPAAVAASNAAEGGHECLAKADAGGACRRLDDWARLGVARAGGGPLVAKTAGDALPADARAALLMPAGANGPAWLVTGNYQAIWRYNRSDAYALSIGLLADALRGAAPMRAAWPTDDPGLSRAQFKTLQERLAALGHAGVSPDGFNGPMTQGAIRAEEERLGWPVTGRGGQRLLRTLGSNAGSAASAVIEGASSAH